MSFVGVDGCKSGWFSVALDESGWSFAVDKNFDYFWSRWSSATAILVSR